MCLSRTHHRVAASTSAVLVALAFVIASHEASSAVGFQALRAYDVGDRDGVVRGADLDGDGFPDLIATGGCIGSDCAHTIRVLRSDGASGFREPLTFDAGVGLMDITVLDVDGDGRFDVVGTSFSSASLVVMRGDGAGSLLAPTAIPVTQAPTQLVSADVDADGADDLVVFCADESVQLYGRDGAGGFTLRATQTVGHARSPIVAEFNGDGRPDVATIYYTGCGLGCPTVGVAIVLGGVSGGLAPPIRYVTGRTAYALAALDFDEDGVTDIALADYGAGADSIRLLRNDGAGNLSDVAHLSAGYDATSILAADFDSNGHVDLVAEIAPVPYGRVRRASVLLSRGALSFDPPIFASVLDTPVVAADLDRDRRVDLVELYNGSLALRRGNGDGTFAATPTRSIGQGPTLVGSGDFDEDGRSDLAIATYGDPVGGVGILRGLGAGDFAAPNSYSANLRSSTAADFDEDGHLDLVAADNTSSYRLLLGNGAGQLTPGPAFDRYLGDFPVQVADVDGDGHVDMLGRAPSVSIFIRGNGDGTFAPAFSFPTYDGQSGFAVGDFDEDGRPDLAAVNTGLGPQPVAHFSILFGDGRGGFTAPMFGRVIGGAPSVPIAGDFDRDGHLDVAFGTLGRGPGSSGAGVWIGLGNGDGTMRPLRQIAIGRSSGELTAGDFDGDGRLDLAVLFSGRSEVAILRGDGAGGFDLPIAFRPHVSPMGLVVSDFDGDGRLDLVVTNSSTDDFSILLNTSIAPYLDCRRGNVNVARGPIADVLFVNGSSGDGLERRVTAAVHAPFGIRVDAPPSNRTGPSPFVLWVWRAVPTPESVKALPRRLGFIGLPTPLRAGVLPQPQLTANNIGFAGALGAENWPGPPTHPAPSILISRSSGVPRAGRFYLQGVILDSAGPNGSGAVTNGVEVRVR